MSTDHPIPELPFVDDSHIPADDGPGIEKIGRKAGEGRWGRHDRCRQEDGGGWVAFTTDWVRGDVGWLVRWHPVQGRSVILYAAEDLSSVHLPYLGQALLYRSGNYWWDGLAWYRPVQVFDRAREQYLVRPVPAATTISAADLLLGGGDAERAAAIPIDQVEPGAPLPGLWLDHLAGWARCRAGTRPLDHCVVTLTAPELSGEALLGMAELAEVAGMAPSTLRAYLSRGQGDVPAAQAVVAGRSMWARPVAEEWAERRAGDPAELPMILTGAEDSSRAKAPAVAQAWDRLTQRFHHLLWEQPSTRKRWALRWRTAETVREVARTLAWEAVADLDARTPHEDLAMTISRAWLQEFRENLTGREHLREADIPVEVPKIPPFLGIAPQVARTLDWLITIDPQAGIAALTQISGDAERDMKLPRTVIRASIETALNLDGTVGGEPLALVLDRLLPQA